MDLSRWTIPVFATLCAVLAPLLGLQSGPHARRDLAALVLDLPSDVEAVVVVANAATQRLSPAGRALAAMASDAGGFDATSEAWRSLASALGWSSQRAFDELLGRRVAIVVRGLESPDRLEWALLSEITPEAEERLRRRLRPAPRGISAGLPILAVENGKFELTINRGRDGSPSTILLASAGAAALFDQLVPVLADQATGETLRMTSAAPLLNRAMSADVAVLLRESAAGGDPAPDAAGGSFLAVWADLEDHGWRARLASSPGTITSAAGAGGAAILPWSADAFNGLADDAIFATMGSIGRTAGVPPLGVLKGHEGWLAPLVLDPGLLGIDDLLGQRSAVFVRPGRRVGCEDNEPLSRVSVTVALETVNARAMAAAGDRMVATTLPLLEGETGGATPNEGMPHFGGAMPDAIRNVPLRGTLASTMRNAIGPLPVLSWGYCESPSPDAAQGTRSGAPAAAQAMPGWWFVSVSASDVPAALVAREALAGDRGPEAANARPRVSVGVVRPAALEAWISRINPGFLDSLSLMRWIESVHWDAWAADNGSIEGTMSLRMTTERLPMTP